MITLISRTKKIGCIICALTFLSLIMTSASYSRASNEEGGRYFTNSQAVCTPGYINAAKQKSEEIITQSGEKKNVMERVLEYVKDKLSSKVAEESNDKVNPELQKKKGPMEDSTKSVSEASCDHIRIGSGTDQYYEDGRLIAEVINGTRYVYAGFDNVGKSSIQDAVNIANAGDKVIVKEGTYELTPYVDFPKDNYDVPGTIDYDTTPMLFVKDGVGVYGGYDENGRRHTGDRSTITNAFIIASDTYSSTAIDGFVFNQDTSSSYWTCIFGQYAINLTVSNSVFNSSTWHYAIYLEDSGDVTIKSNRFNNAGINIFDGTATITRNIFNSVSGDGIGDEGSTLVVEHNKYYNNYTESTSTTSQTSENTDNNRFTFDPFYNYKLNTQPPSWNMLTQHGTNKRLEDSNLASTFKDLLGGKAGSLLKNAEHMDPALLAKLRENLITNPALFIPAAYMEGRKAGDREIKMLLADILNNPTEEQKIVIDVAKAILEEVNKVEDATEESPELKKALDDMLQAVASVLLAQAIPDLLKDQDIANIKNLFANLDSPKGKFIMEYHDATKPYYEQLKKAIEKNANILKLHNLLANNITKEELDKMPRSEIDKMIDKIKRMEKRAVEEEYILQEEVKLKAKYIEPNKKLLEEKTKKMLDDFTKNINTLLTTVDVSKAKAKK